MTATGSQHHKIDPSPWRMLPATPAAPLLRGVRATPGNRNGLPESRPYVYRGGEGVPVENGESCRVCGGKPIITAPQTVRIEHRGTCPADARARARRAA